MLAFGQSVLSCATWQQARGAPLLPAGHTPARTMIGDLDGGGCTDLLYVEDKHVAVWLRASVRVVGGLQYIGGDLRGRALSK